MPYPFIALTFLLFVVFGCTSISHSYASVKQPEASIQASQTAQLALGGQTAISILLSLVVATLALTVLVLLYNLLKKAPAQQQIPYLLQDKSAHLPIFLDEGEEEFPDILSGWGW